MDSLDQFARQVLDAQPFSRFLGTELTRADAEGVTMRLPIADHHKQQHGFVHGGVLSYLADNALTFAGGLALGGDALTSEFKINYLKPAKGEHLEARAEARGVGRRQAVCRCEIHAVENGKVTLCALALGTIVAASK